MIKLVTIMDNVAGEQKSMVAEHGLSFYVETGETRILFDFGSGSHTLENARKLGIRPELADFAVGSHGHYDHAGGYKAFVQAGLRCPLVTGEGFFREKYALNGPKATYLGAGFHSSYLKEQGILHQVCERILPLAGGCWVVGHMKRTRSFETIPERFVIREGEGWVRDDFKDEVCLVLENKGKLSVIVGCSHPGILNILDTVRERFTQPIGAVIGGTHLVEASPERTEMTVHALEDMGVGLLAFNHCSGPLMREIMSGRPGLNTVYLGAGDCLFL